MGREYELIKADSPFSRGLFLNNSKLSLNPLYRFIRLKPCLIERVRLNVVLIILI